MNKLTGKGENEIEAIITHIASKELKRQKEQNHL